MEPQHSFGDWLRLQRKALDLSREGLAQRVACSAATIRKLEAEERRPSAQMAERLAEIFNIPASERSSFLRFARGDWRSKPAVKSEDAPWRKAGELSKQVSPSASQKPVHNLPAQANAFIGRDLELTTIASRLATPGCRLLTLLGPPGIGKTRLAVQAGYNAWMQFPEGVFFVALAPISDSSLVLRTIAQALGIPETAGQSLLDSLIVSLRDRQVLLILDNYEHVLDSALVVAGLLSALPYIKVLSTSREPLNLYGEVVFKVPPLALPKQVHIESLETLAQIASIRLFVQRAQAVNDKFALDETNAAAVVELCKRLDGLPLAIELAAARSNLFEPHSMLSRLDHRLDLLTSHARDLPSRQRTLRGAIEWSYSLLNESERAIYQMLGVFAGSFDLEALQAVSDLQNDSSDALLEVLASLVDKSLLQRISMEDKAGESSGEPRFTMLETLREHARDLLERSGFADTIRQRHVHYFLALAETGHQWIGITPPVRRWLKQVGRSQPDLLAAIGWLINHREVQLSLRLAGALRPFWAIRGYVSEGRQALQAALDLAQEAEPSRYKRDTLAVALNGAGHLALDQGDYEAAQSFIEASLTLWRELRDTRGIAWGLYGLGLVKAFHIHPAAARPLLLESLASAKTAGDRWCIARALEFLGVIYLDESNYPAAQAALDECLAIFRELGDVQGVAAALRSVGFIAHVQGRFSEARTAYEESRVIFSDLDYPAALGWVVQRLGWLAVDQGQYELASSYFQESKDLFHRIGDEVLTVRNQTTLGLIACKQGDRITAEALLQQGLEHPRSTPYILQVAHFGLGRLAFVAGDTAIAYRHLRESLALAYQSSELRWTASCLEAIAGAAIQDGRAGEAARLYGAAERLREKIGAPLPPSELREYQKGVESSQALLTSQAFTEAWAAGRKLSTKEAVTLATEADR